MIEYFFDTLSFKSVFKLLLWLFVVFAVISFIKGAIRKLNAVISNWHQYLDYVPFSPQEFYAAVEKDVEAKNIPGVSIMRITYPQGGIFSMSRLYLRVQCREYIFDICAAPFGKGFFVSYWMGEEADPTRDFWKNLPWMGRFFQKRQKTFFELDNEALFKELVSSSVKKVFAELCTIKGNRIVPESIPA